MTDLTTARRAYIEARARYVAARSKWYKDHPDHTIYECEVSVDDPATVELDRARGEYEEVLRAGWKTLPGSASGAGEEGADPARHPPGSEGEGTRHEGTGVGPPDLPRE